jgi:hypothetical protein
MTPPFLEGVNLTNVVLLLAGLAVVCGLWIAANFVFKMTMRIFALGCLGIIVVGAACAALVWFSR